MDRILVLVVLMVLNDKVTTLKCIQCNTLERNHAHSNNENRMDMSACYEGTMEPQLCQNPNHTHCVTYYFRNIKRGSVMVLWRKCGTKADTMHPCKIHDISTGADTDQYGGTRGSNKKQRYSAHDRSSIEQKQKMQNLVQVCVSGCEEDGCLINACMKMSDAIFIYFILLWSILYSLGFNCL